MNVGESAVQLAQKRWYACAPVTPDSQSRPRPSPGTLSLRHLQVEAVHERTGLRRAQPIETPARETEARERRGLGPGAGRDREALDEPTGSEDEHDELVAFVGVRAHDDDEAVAMRFGQLDLSERRLARNAPRLHRGVAAELGKAQLALAHGCEQEGVAGC